jgi:hypothetical protein
MDDETVVVKLCLTTDSTCATPVSTHVFGTGDVKLVTQIDSTSFQYQTHFAGITPGTSYFVQVWFTNVDDQPMLQATSASFAGS